MEYLILLPIVFIYTAIVWVMVLVIYNWLVEPFDFGPLLSFCLKSAILVLAVTLFRVFVPFGGLGTLLLWWFGLMLIFKKDFWECRVLVFIIWGITFVLDLAIQAIFLPT